MERRDRYQNRLPWFPSPCLARVLNMARLELSDALKRIAQSKKHFGRHPPEIAPTFLAGSSEIVGRPPEAACIL